MGIAMEAFVILELIMLFQGCAQLALRQRCSFGNNTLLYPSVCRCCCLCFIMVVVIRLQGLRITAGSEDIRKFFTGLKIPDGGVHIIGGEHDEAFILFASDEDARRAMKRSGGCIRGSPVELFLSSQTEMQNTLERSTKSRELDKKRQFEEDPRCSRRSVEPERGQWLNVQSGTTPVPEFQDFSQPDDFFVFLRGMPFSVTEVDVSTFFDGLVIDEIVLLKNRHGSNNGNGLVKFRNSDDVYEALKRDREYIGVRYVEVSRASADFWYQTTGRLPETFNRQVSVERDRSPLRSDWSLHQQRAQSPLAQRSNPTDDEFCVLLENLSYAAEKEDIRNLFQDAKLEDDQILHLVSSDGKRTRSSFVLFKSLHDYREALSHEKRLFFNRWVYTRPISREKMIALLESQTLDAEEGVSERPQQQPPSQARSTDSEKCVVFAQNLPFDVRKVEIMDFFHGFDITEDKVILLHDRKGAGVGRALVVFQSEADALRALALNGRRFLGSAVVLKCISRSQMQQVSGESPTQEWTPRKEQYSDRRDDNYRSDDYPDYRNPHDGNGLMSKQDGQTNRDWYYESSPAGHRSYQDRGSGVNDDFGPQMEHFDGPTQVQLINLPFQIRTEEIYDFCYGYRLIPGSVSLQYEQSGKPTGSATAAFESRREAMIAMAELSGRPIGPRKVQLLLV